MPVTFANHTFLNEDGVPVTERVILAQLERLRTTLRANVRALVATSPTPAQFERQMRVLMKDATITQYVIGRGGRSRMTQADWGRVGHQLRTQYAFLRTFVADYPSLSAAQIGARAEMYISASVQSYYRGRATEHRIQLPAYPGDGSTPCLTACGCRWSLQDTGQFVNCWWIINPRLENCGSCDMRASLWNPLVVPYLGA